LVVDILAYEANAYQKLLPTNVIHYFRCITGEDINRLFY